MVISPLDVPLWANAAAISVGSIQGAMYAAGFRDRRLDIFGVAVIGIATGLGGGFLRDILLNRLPLAFTEDWYIGLSVVAALFGMLISSAVPRLDGVITTLDALALGLWASIGTTSAIAIGLPVVPAIFVGIVTGAGGGALRDLLMAVPVSVLHVGTVYAVAAGAGSIALLIANAAGAGVSVSALICVGVTTLVRLLAVWRGWSLPEQRMITSLTEPKLVRGSELGDDGNLPDQGGTA